MDVEERMRLEAAPFSPPLGPLERQRYELVAELCAGADVLQLGCGSGEGSRILAGTARGVEVLDHDAAALDGAQLAATEAGVANLRFAATPLLDALDRSPTETVGATIVCLEALGHPEAREQLWPKLMAAAQSGRRLALAWPAIPRPEADGAAGLTFEATAALRAELPASALVLPQFRAEGSLLLVPDAGETEFAPLDPPEASEPEYADAYLLLVGFAGDELARAHRGRLRVAAQAAPNRLETLMDEEIRTLRAENARLGRAHLGKGGSAAASALHRLSDAEGEIAELRGRLAESEAQADEFAAALIAAAGGDGLAPSSPPADVGPVAPPPVEAVPARALEPAAGEDPNSWEMRHRRAAEVVIPWIEQTVPLDGRTVLEYGAGYGAVTCAVAARAERVIGVDIDSACIAHARGEVAQRGLRNVELAHHELADIVGAVSALRGSVDVFLLYAVLEHLTIDERLEVLRLAREVVQPDGAIVVCETPNRLIYADHHTGQIPFLHLLDDELALRYRHRSPRADILQVLDEAEAQGPEAAREALWRLGRGVSFHEFELAFGERLDRHVIASSYDPALFAERPVHPDEAILWRYLDRWRPDLPPAFSRYWLDLILTPEPVERRPPLVRPWVAQTVASREVGYTADERLRMQGPLSTLWVELPHPTQRLLVGTATQHGRWMILDASPDGAEPSLAAGHMAAAHETAFSDLRLPAPTARIALRASDECDVVFVGYED